MTKDRLAAFSDGVFAIIITIMVLELHPPAGARWVDLAAVAPSFLGYVLSFVYVGIYWNNHHHLLHTLNHVNGLILWANTHLLFWLSLLPFATAWMGQTRFAADPTALYGTALLMPAIGYFLLQRTILGIEGRNSLLALALGFDWKGKGSIVLYALAIGLAYVRPWLADAVYAGVALMWLTPDKRIERILDGRKR